MMTQAMFLFIDQMILVYSGACHHAVYFVLIDQIMTDMLRKYVVLPHVLVSSDKIAE